MHSDEDERVSFETGHQRVVGVLRYPKRSGAHGGRIVITCHGLMSSKDSTKYIQVAKRFTSEDIAVLRFDFRGSGESEGSGNLLSGRVLDLKSAIEFVKEKGFKSIGVLGSSYGGATAIVVACKTPELRALVVWSTPCLMSELFKSMGGSGLDDHAVDARGSREAVESSIFMRDLLRYDVAEAAKKVSRILVIHCKGDRVVPWAHGKLIYDNAKEPKRFELFEDGDHQLMKPSIRKKAIELSLEWFNRYFE